ncbi:MAG: hypothetical protein K0R93_2655 [Anaerosolibacter sp.]|jgi:hypothetical protein|uniref:DUF4367 domain-containing protein n=1 Tax=Anaerosolibacter sp. TaxID=1872527 RepID=UPI002634C098|nr:DUF4367 domain-containing protein [Anaerosolibacter sp.]MDF2547757.1 hypothetical protein [Anaerosolibacter sp.]
MKNQDMLDKAIKEALKDSVESIIVPDMNDVWIYIEHHILQQKMKRLKKAAGFAAAVIILLSFMGIGYMNQGYASYFRSLKFLTTSTATLTHIQVQNKTPGELAQTLEDSNPSQMNDLQEIELPYETALEIANFQVMLPSYIPNGFVLDKVLLIQLGKKTINLRLLYTNGDDILEILQEPIQGEYATISEHLEGGHKYHIIRFTNGFTEMIWDMDEVKYTLKGNVHEEEALKIALSLKSE